MPVFDVGYRRYEGEYRSSALRWTPIVRSSFRTSLGRPLALVIVPAAVTLLVHMMWVYAESTMGKFGPGLGLDWGFTDGTLYDLISTEILFAALLLAASCGGQIANDIRTGALQIYFSKPITQLDYVLGKLGAVMLSALIVTALPGLTLLFGMIAFSPDLGFLGDDPLMPLKAVAYSLLISFVLGSVLLAFSSLGRQGRSVGILFAGFFFFTLALAKVLPQIFRDHRWEAVSLWECLRTAGRSFFVTGSTTGSPPELAWAILGSLTAISLLILSRRASAVEVVA